MNSIQPRKQRKWRFNAALHERKRLVHSRIAKELQEKLKLTKRSIAVRKGDKVKVISGENKGHIGKVLEVDYSDLKIYVEGLMNRTAKGREKPRPIDPSNVAIVDGDFGAGRIAK